MILKANNKLLDAESVGLIKYDVLGLALLDKLSRISETLASGAGLNG